MTHRSLDCLDGVHEACESCACWCHDGPTPPELGQAFPGLKAAHDMGVALTVVRGERTARDVYVDLFASTDGESAIPFEVVARMAQDDGYLIEQCPECGGWGGAHVGVCAANVCATCGYAACTCDRAYELGVGK